MKIIRRVRSIARFLWSKSERAHARKEREIRKLQDAAIAKLDRGAKRLILFLIPGPDKATRVEKISGGIISIVSLCQETQALYENKGTIVAMSTLPDELLIWKHKLFENSTFVFRFGQLGKNFKKIESVLVHVPEFAAAHFYNSLSSRDIKWLSKRKEFHLNVLNQNIRLMPEVSLIAQFKSLTDKVTITTAHIRYCNEMYRRKYGVPLHKLSVWISPENYVFKNYREKENLVVVSPDPHPLKDAILTKLSEIKGLRIQEIRNLTYEQFKALISRAKWTITFGEGLDGYLIEPIFSGAIGFASYNEDFFTPDFKELFTIYSSFEEMQKCILKDIQWLDQESRFVEYQKRQYSLCAKYYSKERYRNNLVSFYEGRYTYP